MESHGVTSCSGCRRHKAGGKVLSISLAWKQPAGMAHSEQEREDMVHVASQTAIIPSWENSCLVRNSVLCLFVVLELNLTIFPSDLLFNCFL